MEHLVTGETTTIFSADYLDDSGSTRETWKRRRYSHPIRAIHDSAPEQKAGREEEEGNHTETKMKGLRDGQKGRQRAPGGALTDNVSRIVFCYFAFKIAQSL